MKALAVKNWRIWHYHLLSSPTKGHPRYPCSRHQSLWSLRLVDLTICLWAFAKCYSSTHRMQYFAKDAQRHASPEMLVSLAQILEAAAAGSRRETDSNLKRSPDPIPKLHTYETVAVAAATAAMSIEVPRLPMGQPVAFRKNWVPFWRRPVACVPSL